MKIAASVVSFLLAATVLTFVWSAQERDPHAEGHSSHSDGSTDVTATQAGAELTKRISAARGGETIVVGAGVYAGNFVVDVPITLVGQKGAVLKGSGTGTVLTLRSSGVVVQGLTITGSGTGPVGSPAGILIDGDDVLLDDVRVEDSYTGIAVAHARSTRIVNSVIIGRAGTRLTDERHALSDHEPSSASMRGDGISLNDARGVLIRGVRIKGARDGIYLSFGTDATIDHAIVTGSRYGLHAMYARYLAVSESRFENNLSGAVLMYGGPVVMLRNTFSRHTSPATGFGVLLRDVTGVEIGRNVMTENRVGLQVEGPAGAASGDNRLLLNTIALNQTGIALFPNAAAAFAGNSIVENVVTVSAQGSGPRLKVEWMDEGAGNFWSGYRGFDGDGDGLGDLPHEESGIISSRIERAPVLAALATSPSFRLADAVQQRWTGRSPLVVDGAPLMAPLSPPLPRDEREGESGVVVGAGAMLVLITAGGSLWKLRLGRARHWGGAAHARV